MIQIIGALFVLFVNHSEQTFTIRTGDRLAQAVFLEKFDVKFEKVNNIEELGNTKKGNGGFGSTGITVIKNMKPNNQIRKKSMRKPIQKLLLNKPLRQLTEN